MDSCSDCICRGCLMWWSGRCPHGGCWDDRRARIEPWPGPERRSWTAWAEPGEQAHWCRGGAFYPIRDKRCEAYVPYDRDRTSVLDCLEGPVAKYQDGYIQCSLINVIGCEECMRRFEERTD